jgi:hypothetical protein
MFLLPLVILYFVLLFALFPVFERLHVADDGDVLSSVDETIIVLLGVALAFLAQAVAGLTTVSYFAHNGEVQMYCGGLAVLITPPLLGISFAGFAKLAIDRSGASRGRLAMNRFGAACLHATWVNPILSILYLIVR